jgi:hypothetical protein
VRSRSAAPLWVGLLLLPALPTTGCRTRSSEMGVELRSRPRLETEFRAYQSMQPHRAFAVAGDPEARFVTGNAHGRESQEVANEVALAMCEMRRADRQIEEPCQLYAVGDELVNP